MLKAISLILLFQDMYTVINMNISFPDEAALSSGSESSVTGAVAEVAGTGAAVGTGSGARAPRAVPTISVTPHSPGILDDPLQHLQRIHQAVHRMRQQACIPQVRMRQISLVDELLIRRINQQTTRSFHN